MSRAFIRVASAGGRLKLSVQPVAGPEVEEVEVWLRYGGYYAGFRSMEELQHEIRKCNELGRRLADASALSKKCDQGVGASSGRISLDASIGLETKLAPRRSSQPENGVQSPGPRLPQTFAEVGRAAKVLPGPGLEAWTAAQAPKTESGVSGPVLGRSAKVEDPFQDPRSRSDERLVLRSSPSLFQERTATRNARSFASEATEDGHCLRQSVNVSSEPPRPNVNCNSVVCSDNAALTKSTTPAAREQIRASSKPKLRVPHLSEVETPLASTSAPSKVLALASRSVSRVPEIGVLSFISKVGRSAKLLDMPDTPPARFSRRAGSPLRMSAKKGRRELAN